jgi:hypothetical protein
LESGFKIVVVLFWAKAVPDAVTVVVLGPSIELSYVGATQANAAVGVRQSCGDPPTAVTLALTSPNPARPVNVTTKDGVCPVSLTARFVRSTKPEVIGTSTQPDTVLPEEFFTVRVATV